MHDPSSKRLSLAERIAKIRLLVLDVDGVVTDGRITYVGAEEEIKSFHVRDGFGIKLWRDSGGRIAIITGRASPALQRRAAELQIDYLIQGAVAKLPALREILTATGLTLEEVCAMGDDLPDLPILRNVGVSACPADACREVLADAELNMQSKGGYGAVRELVETLLVGQVRWKSIVEEFRRET